MTSKKGKAQPAGVCMAPSRTELGKFIRARRLELDMRQDMLAKRTGVTQGFVSRYEIGAAYKRLKERQLDGLAKALQCDAEELRKRMPVKHKAQPRTELGKLIRSRREELGLSLSDFAQKLRMTRQQANVLELRKNPTVRCELVRQLASVLGLESTALAKFAGTTRKQNNSESGQLIRTRRKELGISATALAEKLGVSRQFVNQIELGQHRFIRSNGMLARLAQILEIDVDELKSVLPSR